jgi:hypothetical protein
MTMIAAPLALALTGLLDQCLQVRCAAKKGYAAA